MWSRGPWKDTYKSALIVLIIFCHRRTSTARSQGTVLPWTPSKNFSPEPEQQENTRQMLVDMVNIFTWLSPLPFQKHKGEISCRPTPWLSFLSTALPSSPFSSLLASRPPKKGEIFSRMVERLDFEAGAAWSNHATKVVSRSQERTCSREWTRTKQVGFHRVAILGAGSRKKED